MIYRSILEANGTVIVTEERESWQVSWNPEMRGSSGKWNTHMTQMLSSQWLSPQYWQGREIPDGMYCPFQRTAEQAARRPGTGAWDRVLSDPESELLSGDCILNKVCVNAFFSSLQKMYSCHMYFYLLLISRSIIFNSLLLPKH